MLSRTSSTRRCCSCRWARCCSAPARSRAPNWGGLYKSMPWTATFCIIGAASISAFPLFSGFISKSMVLTAAMDEGHPIVWLLPAVRVRRRAGARGHQGSLLRLLRPRFRHPCQGSAVEHAGGDGGGGVWCASSWASIRSRCTTFCPYTVNFDPYTTSHVLTQFQLLMFAVLAFIFLQQTKLYPPEKVSLNIDAEWPYRWLLPARGAQLRRRLRADRPGCAAGCQARGGTGSSSGSRAITAPRAFWRATMSAGGMAMWVVAFLGLCLILYFV